MRKKLILLLQMAFLVRIPVLVWAAILLAGPALSGNAFGSGLFFIEAAPRGQWFGDDWHRMVYISVAAFLAAAACLVNFNLVSLGAEDRYGLPRRRRRPGLVLALAHLAPLSLTIYVIYRSGWRGSLFTALVVGWVMAALLIFASDWVKNAFVEPPADEARLAA